MLYFNVLSLFVSRLNESPCNLYIYVKFLQFAFLKVMIWFCTSNKFGYCGVYLNLLIIITIIYYIININISVIIVHYIIMYP